MNLLPQFQRIRFYNLRPVVFFLLLSCALTSIQTLRAQTYKPLTSSGEIPLEFRTVTAAKVQQAQREEKKNKRTYAEKKRINEFLLKNNYVIDALLTSGKVLYGDTVTKYIEAVADKLLADDPELRSELRFYTVKSAEVNAFTTNQGIVFVTIGLISQIENEAQLAFVLAHEIAHFEKQHSLAKVLENERVYDQTRNDRYGGYETRMRLLSSFSKDMEFQADSLGYYRFVKAGYKKEAASTMMDVLQWSFLPLDDVEFNTAFLEMDSLIFPNSFSLDSLASIPLFDDDEDDSNSSHPNIRKRRNILDQLIKNTPQGSDKNYLLGKNYFERVQELSRMELIHLSLLDRQYISAFYNSYALLTKKPGDQYLEESIGKALYGISKYKNSNDLLKVCQESDETYSHFQNCTYLFEKLEEEQVNLIAIRYLAYLYDKYHSTFIDKLLNDLIAEGVKENKLTSTSFEAGVLEWKNRSLSPAVEEKKNDVEEDSIDPKKTEDPDNSEEKSSKFAKLRETKSAVTNKISAASDDSQIKELYSEKFHYRAFEVMDLVPLKERIAAMEKMVKEKEASEEKWQEDLRKNERYYKRNGYALDIDSIVIVDPFFFEIDERRGIALTNSEKELIEYKDQIALCAETSGIDSEILFPKQMSDSEVYQYNSMAIMNDWMSERIDHDNDDVEMIPLQSEYTAVLAKEYGTPYFCYTGVYTATYKKDNSYLLQLGCLAFVIFPYVIYRVVSPAHQTNFYFLLYDVEKGEAVWVMEREIRSDASDGNINSLLYDTFYQVKNDR
ncbi:MAG: M48 family metallopeptidase [Flavobacteriales bacterium]